MRGNTSLTSSCMGILTNFRLQMALVAVLVLGSVAALVLNVFTAVVPRERELAVREQLRDASRQMASDAAAQWKRLDSAGIEGRDEIDRTLASIRARSHASYPGGY
jgi:hypothetical protein